MKSIITVLFFLLFFSHLIQAHFENKIVLTWFNNVLEVDNILVLRTYSFSNYEENCRTWQEAPNEDILSAEAR